MELEDLDNGDMFFGTTWIGMGQAVADSPTPDQNFLNFMQFFGKIWQICMLAPPNAGLAPPSHEESWIRP